MVTPTSFPDQILVSMDRALRALLAPPPASRPAPGEPAPVADPVQRRQTAGLMRVNHAGEIAAQGLYHGQAMVARNPVTRALLDRAAREETDHLAWCEQRLRELGDRPSLLDPLWYAGSFVIGAAAGLAGDRHSLGFVAETERQVERHLDQHLAQVPAADRRSRAILEQMRADEQAHGKLAVESGGRQLPRPVRLLMQTTARVMTGTARWI
ncbi:MAG TPA: 2-polyprenyl-3-methyl-6-methoxy-1,4-benzoquinone monooxygenase [Steroidobacteraceae bacterium]|nr:2-polyprenyl-3-methyl-6-methoxy-1,4-benzoquinone monooxygenase [Steroidobacteraceae bacterium]